MHFSAIDCNAGARRWTCGCGGRGGRRDLAGNFFLQLAIGPILVAAFEPIGEIHLRNGVADRWLDGFEFFDDVAVGEAIIEPLVKQVPSRRGETGETSGTKCRRKGKAAHNVFVRSRRRSNTFENATPSGAIPAVETIQFTYFDLDNY